MKKITFSDYSGWVEGKERNGGGYGFTETAIIDEAGHIVSGEYSTTTDFSYCPNCGRFENSDSHYEECNEYQPSWVMEAIIAYLNGVGDEPTFEEDGVGYNVEEL